MPFATQLLCTFCTPETLDFTIKEIISTYKIAFDSIYVLENTENSEMLCCTYNVELNSGNAPLNNEILQSTISLHRKKMTNTLYTINALNALIAELNNGYVDKEFKIPWELYKNTILVTAYNKLKKINTKLFKIIKVSEMA